MDWCQGGQFWTATHLQFVQQYWHIGLHSLLFRRSMLEFCFISKDLKQNAKKMVLNFTPEHSWWDWSCKHLEYHAPQACFSGRNVALSVSPVWYVFYFIENGVEYLPFKKMNRKMLRPKEVGVGNQWTQVRLAESSSLQLAQCFRSEEPYSLYILLCPQSPAVEMFNFLLPCQGDYGVRQGSYLAQKK